MNAFFTIINCEELLLSFEETGNICYTTHTKIGREDWITFCSYSDTFEDFHSDPWNAVLQSMTSSGSSLHCPGLL